MSGWTELCTPAKLYLLFMVAVVLFDMASGYARHAMRNTVYGIFGTFALWVLCAANMDFAAWGLLALPLFFFIVLIALWVFDGVLFTTSREFKHRRHHGEPWPFPNDEPILVTEYKCEQPLLEENGSCTS
jgi:hypothetical protein